ncbi:SusC/RagA family TonB-linked outer membrane protein [Flexithrix dorotheae]|uniref:SusC/RagA family TonB-linked outer membrane protein n=1 Tax=Flexithrix dorotheae TaxID=70993 RepID=UPI000376E4E0|nr:TonB-dependent receptor [Flexithrix dorotheae]
MKMYFLLQRNLNSKSFFIGFILMFQGILIQAQDARISGVVNDENGTPLPGVSILIKGTSNGTTTDLDGNYLISVPPASTLIFSYIGYVSQEIVVENQSQINVDLVPDAEQLDEIVVVGYGTQKKTDLTGSVASADLQAFKEAPNGNILQSLQGSVPGVAIGQVNQAGQEPNINIRGNSTINGNQSSLIVLDGIIYRGRIGDINPADIKSVDILKDPSSKAIYGAQASNGVILITTNGGKVARKPTINYSGSYAFQSPTNDATLLNRDQVLQKVKNIEYENAFLAPDYTQPNPDWDYSQSELLPALLDGIDKGTDYDWWGALTGPGHFTDHVVSISGGTDATQYYISGGYTDQKGIMMNDNYQRTSLRINVQTDVTDWLTIGANTFGAFTDFSGQNPNLSTLGRTSPLVTPYDENGDFIVNHLGDNIVNPFLDAQADDRELVNNIMGNFFGILKIPGVEGFSYRVNFSNNIRWGSHAYSNVYDAGLTGAASKTHETTKDVLLDNIFNYTRDFNDHSLTATFVYGFNKINYDRTQATGENIPNLSLSYNSLEQAIIQRIGSGAWEEALLYQMGRISYDYKNRYLLTATLRRDGFSGFSKNNKFGLFPSVGLGWVLSEEGFFNSEKIDFLKVRASYGENGNQTSRYSSLASVSAGGSSRYVFGDGSPTAPGQSVASLANNDLTWETTVGFNFGLDFDLFNDRISGNIEYYNSTTNDLLWNQVLPQITGFSEIRTNLGEVKNRGWEFSLLTKPVQTSDFTWGLNFMFWSNKNEIVSLLGEDKDGDGMEDDLVASGLFIGESIGTIYSYEVDGVWTIGDDIPEGYFPGSYRLVDQNGDGEIDATNDRKILGRTEPAYRFGIQNTLQYKGFTLKFFINSVQGGKNSYLAANHTNGIAGTTGTAQNTNWFTFYDYWSPSNPGAKYSNPWVPAQIRPARYFQRSFVRLQDISLAYQLDNEIAQKVGFQNAKVFVSGKNLFTSTKWDGWDPETGQGIGNSGAFPVLKSISMGIDLSF